MSRTHLIDHEQQGSGYGYDKLDYELKTGPLASRSCNDIFCLITFLGTWAFMVFLALNAYRDGDIKKVINPYDSNNNQCGFKEFKDYSNVYIMDTDTFYCVKECPGDGDKNKPLQCKECNNANAFYASQQIITLCLPSFDSKMYKIVSGMINTGNLQDYFGDLQQTWPVILGSAGIAFIVCLILTVLIKYTASCIVWGMIIIYLIVLAGIGTIAYVQQNSKDLDDIKYIRDESTLKWIQWIFWSLAILSLLLILCFAKQIKTAISILKAAADFTRDEWQAIFIPIFTFVFIVGFIAFWLVTSAFIYSTGDVSRSPNHPYNEFKWQNKTGYQLIFYLFGLLWNVSFCIAFCQFVISSACCFWYFKQAGADVSSPILKSICRGLTYNLGSIVFGALILAVVWSVKIVLDYIHKQMKDVLQANGAINCLMKYCQCLVSCFEKFVRFLNQNAYIMIALTGRGFCGAAKEVFSLIFRNTSRVFITHGLGELFEFIGSLFVSALTTIICYFIITQSSAYKNSLTSPIAPTIAFILIGYVIGRMFMSLYAMGVDAILICYLVDYEANRNEGGPKHAPPTLQHFLSEYS